VHDVDALGLPPIRGVVHAASDAGECAAESLAEAEPNSPLARGAEVLHETFRPGALDFLVLFSSAGHLLGLPGSAARGVTAGVLDALAAARAETDGDHTLSIGWTSDITPAESSAAWEFAIRHGSGAFAVLRTGVEETLPLLSELTAEEPSSSEEPDEGSLADLSPEQLRERLTEEIGAQIATEMKLPAGDLDPRRSLVEQGLDSVMTMMVRRRLEKRFGHSLPATLLWQKPTVLAITDHLVDLLNPAEEPQTEETEAAPLVVG